MGIFQSSVTCSHHRSIASVIDWEYPGYWQPKYSKYLDLSAIYQKALLIDRISAWRTSQTAEPQTIVIETFTIWRQNVELSRTTWYSKSNRLHYIKVGRLGRMNQSQQDWFTESVPWNPYSCNVFFFLFSSLHPVQELVSCGSVIFVVSNFHVDPILECMEKESVHSELHWKDHRELCNSSYGVGVRGNSHIRAYISSIQHKNLTPYRFVVDSSQMIKSALIWGSLKLILVSNQLRKVTLWTALLFQDFYVGWMTCMFVYDKLPLSKQVEIIACESIP